MRKFATLAALAVCAGTVVGGATTATAGINIGDDPAGNTGTPAAGSLDFANAWCGAPWLWSGQQQAGGAPCDAAHGGAVSGAAGQ